MKRFFTSSTLFGLLTAFMLAGPLTSNAQKTAMNFLSGRSYNLDVIIDSMPFIKQNNWPYSKGMIDTVFSRTLVPNTSIYNRFSLVCDSVIATGLPAIGGTITSANPQAFTPTPPIYNVAPASVPNAMHLTNVVADTFMFTDSTLIG